MSLGPREYAPVMWGQYNPGLLAVKQCSYAMGMLQNRFVMWDDAVNDSLCLLGVKQSEIQRRHPEPCMQRSRRSM